MSKTLKLELSRDCLGFLDCPWLLGLCQRLTASMTVPGFCGLLGVWDWEEEKIQMVVWLWVFGTVSKSQDWVSSKAWDCPGLLGFLQKTQQSWALGTVPKAQTFTCFRLGLSSDILGKNKHLVWEIWVFGSILKSRDCPEVPGLSRISGTLPKPQQSWDCPWLLGL